MKSNEMRALPLQELEERLEEYVRKLYELRVKATLKELESFSVIGKQRRDIARLKQVIAEKRKALAASAAAKA
ncbi:MAG: 50S ribosomal protein L29 [bacterium]|nr:50S ribosomal protein L29 [Candidatus Sumerlaeota bacterium]